jgi:isocitrate dehydrogenase (NAD+)
MVRVTLIPGDGIGPEVSAIMKQVVAATGVDIHWDIEEAGLHMFERTGELVPASVYASIEQNRIAIKGPITTPIAKGFRSINVALRLKYDLYACVRPVKSIGIVSSKFENVDLTIFRENTEDLYMGLEEQVSPDEARSIKVITRFKSERICRSAFEYAKLHHKTNVAVVTKANIMKLSDGLFLEVARHVANDYPEILMQEVLVDNMCMQLVIRPQKYQVIVTENLYGDILSDLAAGLVGGLGFVPGANLGNDIAIFESVHGSALDIQGQGIANPTAMILTSAMMLRHLGYATEASWIQQAVDIVYRSSENFTCDLGGKLGSQAIGDKIIAVLTDLKGTSHDKETT